MPMILKDGEYIYIPPKKNKRGGRWSAIDEHKERMDVKRRHPDHPTLTPKALRILELLSQKKENKS